MTRLHKLPSSPSALCRFGISAGIACAVLSLTSCQGGEGTASLPTPSQPRAEAHAQSPSAAEIEAVRQAYQQFVALLDRATSLPDSTRKAQLSQHTTEPQLSKVLQVAAKHQKHKIASYGYSIVHIRDVQVRNGEAEVRDCQDSSKAGLRNSSTGKKLNRGVAQENVRATLKKSADGRWRVSRYTVIGEGC